MGEWGQGKIGEAGGGEGVGMGITMCNDKRLYFKILNKKE